MKSIGYVGDGTILLMAAMLVAGPAAAQPWNEVAKLTASDGAANDNFGYSVAISGDRALVGADWDDDKGDKSGSAYVFEWDGSNWVEEAKLTASDGAAGDHFGVSVAISGDRALVGAYLHDKGSATDIGSVYVFEWDGNSWVEVAKLTASDGAAGDQFGISVSISGDRALVGADWDDDKGDKSGSAYVFEWDGNSWVEVAKLTASDGEAGDYFAHEVSISGDRALVGAYGDDDRGTDSGSAYVFEWDGSTWNEVAKLTATDGAANDRFGRSVVIKGDRILIGSRWDDDRGTDSGSAYVFEWDGSTWNEVAKLTATDGETGDLFGRWLSISGDRALIGAHQDDDRGANSGSAYVFEWDGNSWVEVAKLTASDGAGGDWFGWAVSLDGNRALVGARFGSGSGAAYVFETTSGSGNTYAISGTVTDEGGSGLGGVTLTLSGATSATTSTDDSGSYAFAGLADGTYTITPSRAGYVFEPPSREVTISGGDVTGQDFSASISNADGLVAYYPFNGNANDESGNGHDGTVLGTTLTSDRFGTPNSAYNFNGNDSRIDLGNPVDFESPLSFSGWFRLDAAAESQWNTLFMKSQYCSGFGVMYNANTDQSGRKFFRIYNSSCEGIAGTDVDYMVTYADWVHYTLVYDGVSLETYINGNLVGTHAYSSSILDEDQMWLGANGPDDRVNGYYHFTGDIDDVRIYDRALTSDEVLALCEEGGWECGGSTLDGLVAYYPFNGNANDESGNGHDGTVNGATLTSDRFGRDDVAYSFDGNNDYIEVPSDPGFTMSEISISAWIWLDRDIGNEQARIVNRQSTSGGLEAWGLEIFGNNYASSGPGNKLAFHANTGTDAANTISPTLLETGRWYHVVGTSDGIEARLYINGVLDITAPAPGSLDPNNNADIVIGKTGPQSNFYFPGIIDDIRIYNRALSETEVAELCEEGGWQGCGDAGISTYTLSGTVTDVGGSRLEGVTLTLSGAASATTSTDASGNYAFTGLADGTYTITPSRAGYVFEPPSREVTVSGGDVTGQDFTGISLDPGPPGTTVIIHGHRGATDFEDEGITEDQEWTLTMAQAIIHRIGAGRVYVIGCDPPDTSRGECGGQIVGPDVLEELMPGLEFELGNDWEGENVIVFDWLEESNDAVAGYAEAAADALTALLIKGALDNKWELDRLHFIGHSRGAVVASETIQRLAWHSRNEGGKISGQDVDQNLHFTILDGHPWDDENWDTIDEPLGGGSAEDHGVNTFENQIFWRGGYRREFGVVCWKEIVGYCENYWQSDSDVWSGNANLDGLPGIPGVSNNGNYNLSEKLEPLLFFFTFGHTKVHRWYHGTINVTSDNDGYINDQVGYCENACGPVEADWYSEEGEGCGRKFSRHISGYNRSLRGGGEELASCISVDPSTAVSIYDDVSLMEFSRASTGIIKLYNGDFEYNDTFSLQIPGWSHHCGGIECGGNGGVDALDAMLNAHLELDLGNSWKRHNWLYVPKSVSKIFFRVRVSDGDFEWNENNLDRLRVYVGIETGENGTGEVEVTEFEGSDYPCLDRRIRSRTEYQTCSFSVEAYQGKPVTLRFELDGGGDNNIDSEIWIDDVGFVEPNYLRASLLAAQVSGKTGEQKSSRSGHVAYLHVYDAAGNHTGPTSDSTYVTEIPGSRYIMKYDSLLGPLQTVVLPPATDENAYRFEITSTGAEALVNVAFEDVTQGDRTVTARFEDIPLSAAGVARSAFSAVTPDLAIDIDDNGDGVPEDTLSPGVFSKNFFILASAGEGGSITPTGTNVATYGDTLSFSIIPDEGWVIDEVMVDSMSLGSIDSYSFENIRADHTISAVFRPTGVDVENDDNILPDRYDLQQNYPNPFASRTSITYSLPVASHVSLKLYDVLGREVMVLVDEPQQAGYHTLTLDASEMSAGIYFYQLQAGSFMATRALMIVR